MGKIVGFNDSKVEILNYENLNEELMRCKVRVMYSGLNDNGYNIERHVIDKALDSIYYIPIVGEVVEYENGTSFGDHAITQEDDGSFVCNTIPFGVVAGKHDNEITWEKVGDKEYLTVTGYLWRRYDLVSKFEKQDFYQSMEIAVNKSRKRRGKTIVDVLDFDFSALCILNKDLDNYENSVAPCFDGANIEKFQKNNKFNAEMNELINKIESFSAKKGDDTVEDKELQSFAQEEDKKEGCFAEETKEETKEAPETEEDTVEEVKEGTEEETVEEAPAVEEPQATEPEVAETTEEEIVEDVVEELKEEDNEEVKATFSLSLDEKLNQIREELGKRTIEVEYCWGDKYTENEYYYETLFQTEELGDVVVVNSNSYSEKYFIPYTINGDAIVLDFDNKVRCVATYRAFEGLEFVPTANEKIETMVVNFEKYTNNLQTSIQELKEFRRAVEFAKREADVNDMIAKFDFEETEIAEFKNKAISGEIEIETLELHLFALAGKKAMASFKKETKEEIVKFNKTNKVNVNPYGDLIR